MTSSYVTTLKATSTVIILGNIGSGKTLQTELLSKVLPQESCIPIYEPVDEWRKSKILDAFYANPKELAGMFQVYTLSSRAARIDKAIQEHETRKKLELQPLLKVDPTVILNTAESVTINGWCKLSFPRNNLLDIHLQLPNVTKLASIMEKPMLYLSDAFILNDKHVFFEALKKDGMIDSSQALIYENTYNNWKDTLIHKLGKCYFIYIQTPVYKCFHQKENRGREEELEKSTTPSENEKTSLHKNSGVTLEYLTELEDEFKLLYYNLKHHPTTKCDMTTPCEVAYVDGRENEENVHKQIVTQLILWNLIQKSN